MSRRIGHDQGEDHEEGCIVRAWRKVRAKADNTTWRELTGQVITDQASDMMPQRDISQSESSDDVGNDRDDDPEASHVLHLVVHPDDEEDPKGDGDTVWDLKHGGKEGGIPETLDDDGSEIGDTWKISKLACLDEDGG